jgi:hypothetical protein
MIGIDALGASDTGIGAGVMDIFSSFMPGSDKKAGGGDAALAQANADKQRALDDARRAQDDAKTWKMVALGGGALLIVGIAGGLIAFTGKK